jgi:Calx-beta domain
MPTRIVTLFVCLIALCVAASPASAAPKKTFVRFTSGSYSVVEANTTFKLTVTRSGNTAVASTASVSVTGGTATSPANYSFTSPTTVSFAAKQTTATVDVTINDDTTFSGANKTIVFSLTAAGNPTRTATLTILDNDGPGTIDFDSANYNVVEGAGLATISVTRHSATNLVETVDYATVARPAGAGNATAGVDYMTSSGTLTFQPDEMTKTFQVPILDDSLSEGNELINLSLSNPNNLTTAGTPNLGPNASLPATLTIVDDDSTYSFSNDLYAVAETVASGVATITVNRGGATNLPSSVYYSTSDGTATQPGDYTATSGTLNFAAGEAQKTFDVPIVNDGTPEPTESVNLSLAQSSAPGALVLATSTLNIQDNDSPQATVQLSDATYSVNEGDGNLAVTVTLSHAMDGDVTVALSTDDTGSFTATGGSDFTAQTNTPITFVGKTNDPNHVGETSKTVQIPIADDQEVEGDETFGLVLSNPTGATLDTPSTATATIHDNDLAGDFEFTALRYDAAESSVQATITVRRVGGSTGPASVDYSTSDGTAIAPGDYTPVSGTLQFADGETQKTFVVPITWDGRAEGDETVNLELDNPSANSDLATNSASVLHIADDGASGPVQFTASSYSVNEADDSVTITVTRSGGSVGGPVSVDYATSDGSATAGSDYTATSGTLTFAAGETNKSFTVPILNDTVHEDGESFTVALANPAGGTSLGGQSSATVAIADDDAATGGPQSTPANPNPAGSQTAARDKTAPKLTLTAKAIQKAFEAKLLALTAKCNENCKLAATAKVVVVSKSGKRGKPVTLGKASGRVAAGKIAGLKIKLSKTALAKLAQALNAGKVRVTITVVAADAAGNKRTGSRVVTVKR